MTTLFIADTHIGSENPEIEERFTDFLRQLSAGATKPDALYILGDLFEIWIGDDAILPEHRSSITALKQLTQSGIPVYVMHGNRDFLMGNVFEETTGCQLIPDPIVIDLYGTPTLLMHGDNLCTDDKEYSQFRNQVRNEAWQKQFLSSTVEQRHAVARQYREESRKRNQGKAPTIMDVNDEAVIATLQQYNVRQLIHGHTHRPNVHNLIVDGQAANRTVLGDWYTQDSILVCDERGCVLQQHYS